MKLAGGRVNRVALDERARLDTYHTPWCATLCLLEHERFDGTILEPACGEGYIAAGLESLGHSIVAYDVRGEGIWPKGAGGVDFFTRTGEMSNIVTNPPFCRAEEFIEHGRSLFTGKMALLLRLTFLNGLRRFELWRRYRPARIIALAKRLPYQTPDGKWIKYGGQFDHAWFIWDKGAERGGTSLTLSLPDRNLIVPPGLEAEAIMTTQRKMFS